jgi:hypothetical protein
LVLGKGGEAGGGPSLVVLVASAIQVDAWSNKSSRRITKTDTARKLFEGGRSLALVSWRLRPATSHQSVAAFDLGAHHINRHNYEDIITSRAREQDPERNGDGVNQDCLRIGTLQG